jgi:hypothetical protein
VIGKPTLIVHTTYFPVTNPFDAARDPERAAAVRLGEDLYELLTRPKLDPLAWGAGILVRVATSGGFIDCKEAEHVVVIPVLGFDSFTHRSVRDNAMEEIARWHSSGAKVFPLFDADQWRRTEKRLPGKPLLTNLYPKGDPGRATLNEILLAVARVLARNDGYASQLFISHAKVDLPASGKAAEEIQRHVETETTGKAFFDKVSILAGDSLTEQIDQAASQGVFVAIRTDMYSSRVWCRRELLKAKERQVPTLTVEALSSGEARSAAYGGNGPTVVWDRTAHAAARVMTLAMVEAVRHLFFHREAARIIKATDLPETTRCISRPPELIDIAALRGRADAALPVLYPDPPLPSFERAVLLEADKRLRPATPTTAFAGAIGSSIQAPLDTWKIAISISDSRDTPEGGGPRGLTADHIRDVTVFLARALIGVGGAIAYGGDFRKNGFTRLLAQLVSSYNETARADADCLHSYLAAGISPSDGRDVVFETHSLREGGALLAPPPESGITAARLALYDSDMRRLMAIETSARVVLGGTTAPKKAPDDKNGYRGRYPGVVEEAWRTLQHGKPLYVAGGFGGAAALVARALESKEVSPDLDEKTWADNPTWTALVGELDRDPDFRALGLPPTQADLHEAIHTLGREYLTSDDLSVRSNGLTVDENRELFVTRDPLTVAALVLKGLIAVSTLKSQGKLRVELVEGDASGATDLELLVFPTFSDLALDGAGAALDRVSGGAATRAHKSRRVVTSGSSALGAQCLFAADLGRMNSALKEPARAAEMASSEVARLIRRHGFKRVGIVTFLGNVASELSEVVGAMLRGLGLAAKTADFVWFEMDPVRAAVVAKVLGAAKDVVLTRRAAPVPASYGPAARRRTIVAVRQDERKLNVALLFHQSNGLAPVVLTEFDEAKRQSLTDTADRSAPATDAIASRGAKIVELVFGSRPSSVLEAVGDSELVVMHDGFAGGIPYEAMTWLVNGQPVTPATQGGIVRHVLAEGASPERALTRPPRARKLGVLVVIDPLCDLPEARREGEALVDLLRQGGFQPKVLKGPEAIVDDVRKGIEDPEIDVLHYCGHAFFSRTGADGSGLNCANGRLTLADLKGDGDNRVASVPRLAFVNACEAGRVQGLPLDVRAPQAFADFFLSAGVDAYLGAFWRVSDKGASAFAADVYTRLTGGAELGEAVVAGRKSLQDAGNKDWANYVLYGHAGFRLVQPAAVAPALPAGEPPPPSFRRDAKIVVASWTFLAESAPRVFAAAVFDAASGEPIELDGPMRVERREGWSGATAVVTWIVTATLRTLSPNPIELRPTEGARIEVPPADAPPANDKTRGTGDSAPQSPRQTQLRRLRALLEQQPDGGRAVLEAMQPSADAIELRAAIDAEASKPDDRAVWPFSELSPAQVDGQLLAEFVAAYQLDPIRVEDAALQKFQTKEDWQSYAFASGAIGFTVGSKVDLPLWPKLSNPAKAMTHDLRDGEFAGDTIELALFSDNANGLHASRSIAKQIVASGLPYAFHLGDVYYGGSQQEFKDYFEDPLSPMLERTEFFMIAGNHEMFAKGKYFQEFLLRKARQHEKRQRQCGEMFRLRGPGFRILGIDTMFVGADSGRFRLHDYADAGVLQVLSSWLAEDTSDFTILMTTNEAWDKGTRSVTPLYESLRTTIAGRVDMWFWGNVHYAALYEPWAFLDAGSPTRHVVPCCIGHGGYPFYTETTVGDLPEGVDCRWLEKKHRFWPDARIRPDVGANGWCRLKLTRVDQGWDVGLRFIDWAGRDRLLASFTRKDGQTIRFVDVKESEQAAVAAPITWVDVPEKRKAM